MIKVLPLTNNMRYVILNLLVTPQYEDKFNNSVVQNGYVLCHKMQIPDNYIDLDKRCQQEHNIQGDRDGLVSADKELSTELMNKYGNEPVWAEPFDITLPFQCEQQIVNKEMLWKPGDYELFTDNFQQGIDNPHQRLPIMQVTLRAVTRGASRTSISSRHFGRGGVEIGRNAGGAGGGAGGGGGGLPRPSRRGGGGSESADGPIPLPAEYPRAVSG